MCLLSLPGDVRRVLQCRRPTDCEIHGSRGCWHRDVEIAGLGESFVVLRSYIAHLEDCECFYILGAGLTADGGGRKETSQSSKQKQTNASRHDSDKSTSADSNNKASICETEPQLLIMNKISFSPPRLSSFSTAPFSTISLSPLLQLTGQ